MSGFDCSGLVQFSFRQAGVMLPRSTAGQRHAAARVRVSHLRRGDLLLFRPSREEELAPRHLRGRRTIRARPVLRQARAQGSARLAILEEASAGGATVLHHLTSSAAAGWFGPMTGYAEACSQ